MLEGRNTRYLNIFENISIENRPCVECTTDDRPPGVWVRVILIMHRLLAGNYNNQQLKPSNLEADISLTVGAVRWLVTVIP